MFKGALIVLVSLVLPVVHAVQYGSTYQYAVTLIAVGIAFYVAEMFLIQLYLAADERKCVMNGLMESTVCKSAVPQWVSGIGVVPIGLIPSAIVIVLLITMGVITAS